ncbi:hypothetical protein PV11_04909 [Exophiala sideris]|uniref:Uncharacterized protein n=1 Tax=Exophiala sideris TaxID=1016849 RepID=A0A0D1X570_9EURO|nr:hypothetical protein PV11_04909 [Exophiala sideris]
MPTGAAERWGSKLDEEDAYKSEKQLSQALLRKMQRPDARISSCLTSRGYDRPGQLGSLRSSTNLHWKYMLRRGFYGQLCYLGQLQILENTNFWNPLPWTPWNNEGGSEPCSSFQRGEPALSQISMDFPSASTSLEQPKMDLEYRTKIVHPVSK